MYSALGARLTLAAEHTVNGRFMGSGSDGVLGAVLPSPRVPGTAVDDPAHPAGRLAGVPVGLPGAAVAVPDWVIDHHATGGQ